MNEIVKNFESIASALVESGTTEKAKAFASRLADQIRAKGDDWIISKEMALEIMHDSDWHDAIAPVADNRLFYLTRWQVALR